MAIVTQSVPPFEPPRPDQRPQTTDAPQRTHEAHIHPDPPDADQRFRHLLDGRGEEEGDGQPHSAVERERHEHRAGGHLVSRQDVGTERDEDDDLVGHEEGRHVEGAQVGALHDAGTLLPEWQETFWELTFLNNISQGR